MDISFLPVKAAPAVPAPAPAPAPIAAPLPPPARPPISAPTAEPPPMAMMSRFLWDFPSKVTSRVLISTQEPPAWTEVSATLRRAGVERRPECRALTTVPLARASRGTTTLPPMMIGSETVPSKESPDWLVPLEIVEPKMRCMSVPAGIVTGLGPSIRLSKPPELPPLGEEEFPAEFAFSPLFEQPDKHRAVAIKIIRGSTA